MAEGNLGGGTKMGSVKAAIDMYGQRAIRRGSPQLDSPVAKSSSGAEDLHKSERELGIYRDSRRAADSTKAKAQAELRKAKKTVEELTLLIEKSSHGSRKRDIEAVKKSRIDEDGDKNGRYAQIMRELESVKQELSKLKLDIAYVLREKAVAEKKVHELEIKTEENLKLLESLRLEIDIANEEHILVELAKIEALKEHKEIEDQREKEEKEVFDSLEERRKRIRETTEDIAKSKEIEKELSETLSDIDMLETQLKLVKEMERRVQRKDSFSRSNRSFERGKDNLSVLKQVTEATEAKKEELASINAKLFLLITEMDALRQEINQTKQETARIDRIIQKDDVKIEKLNSKLLMAKARLESVAAAEERISCLADHLTCSFEKLKNDKEAAKKQEVSFKEEAREIQKTEIKLSEKEKELLLKLDELEKVKRAEVLALAKLESLAENAMETRELDSKRNSTITISRFEYEYLSGHACHAEETAEKKVVAAMAWVEALKASTKAILMKTESLKRESGITTVEEEREEFRMKRSLSSKRIFQSEIEKFKQNPEEESLFSPKPVRKSVRLSGRYSQAQAGKTRRYSSGARGTPTFFIIKKKKKVPNLVKFFSRKK